MLLTCLFSVSIYAQTFSGNTGAIPDNSCNENHEFTNFVSGVDASYVVTDVTININHTWDSDLDIFLIAPDGTELELSTDNGSSGDNYTGTNFNALAANSITSGSAPFTGDFSPEGNMSSLYGINPNDDWKIRVCDDAGGDTGTLESWSITFGEEPEVPPTPCEMAESIACGDTVMGSTDGASPSNVPFCGTSLSTAPGKWYVFAGTGDVIDIDVSTAGSDYDTKLGVFSGDCFNLQCEAGDDDDGPGLTSQLTFTTEVGTDYLIYVTGFSSNSGDYTLNLSCRLQAEIAQDCSTVYYGYEAQACAELSVNTQYGELPYSYLWSTGETTATISACPSVTTTYSVTVTDALGDSVTDDTVVVAVDVTCGNSSNGKVLVCHRTSSGDYNTICISPNAVQTHLDHGDSLGECGNTFTCDTAPACDVVVTPSNGATDVSLGTDISWTTASGYVLGYTVSVGTTSGGTDVADSVDVGTSTSYDADLDFETTYYVTVTPYNDTGSAEGCGESSFTTEDNPCNSATEISCGDVVNGSTVGASVQSGLSCGFVSLDTAGGAWYSFTGDGSIISALVSTDGSDYDTKLGVFTGNCDALECVQGNDDGGPGLTSEVEFSTIDGVTYLIYVTGFGSNEGNYTLSLTCEAPPEATLVTCGETLNTTYCYTSNEDTSFVYASSDGSTLDVSFLSGEVENNFDELIILDSDGSELYNGYGNSGNLAGLSFTSSGDSITVRIDSDSSISCESSSNIDGWDYSVSCTGTSGRIAQPDFAVYPNPSKDGNFELDLRDYKNQDLDIKIVDLRGNVITKESITNLTAPTHSLRMNNAVNGLYFVSIQTNKGVKTKKLIIAY